MPGVTGLFDIGKKSLFASQTAIEVVGNNISNANTEGYSRQAVVLQDGQYIQFSPGQLGTGVQAAEIIRYFDEYIEARYNTKSAEEQRWATLHENLQGVEGILSEATTKGIGSALEQFWADWQTLSGDPRNGSVRAELLGHVSALESAIQTAEDGLQAMQLAADDAISREVEDINGILSSIAAVNAQIATIEASGTNNANGLRDERASLVRDLAEKMDITYIDNGLGNVTVLTKAGHTLVDGTEVFRLAFEAPQAIADLTKTSTFDGTISFDGESSSEYTVEIVDPGLVGAATYKVSLDGGNTWLKDANGVSVFTTTEKGALLPDGKGSLAFDSGSGELLREGDRFQVLPQKSLFWYENSSTKMNITPQILANGEDNERRLTGGGLTGYFQFRDASVGGFIEKMNAFSSSLAWEVNRLHSQGAGLERFSEVTGTYKVLDSDEALGSREAGLAFGDRLATGNVVVHTYNQTTGALESSRSLDFSAITPPGVVNFDPSEHSLQDVAAVFNSSLGGDITATISDGRLQLTVANGHDIAFGSDSSGLLAALGINTFFEGSDADTLALNAAIVGNASFINAGHVNGAGEMNSGDNTTASAIAALQTTDVKIVTSSMSSSSQTLGEYYSALVALVGSEVSTAKFNREYNAALASDLKAQQEAVSGVNLDEEMTNLIKFQHAYTAAAKLITTADSMMQVLLGLKS
ncbi:MAG: flagellar hook-associated protein FlgK [Deltaproteobacteria bacterium]|nr:flagellar hook-associated protein FlgK [Deltaproteobacteria bacterium]